ncbi:MULTISPECIES: LysM peptidoglycan-binding domain-containing protein [unclassified Wenzhouxiangella]|uniref:lytic transglycosylase n=1 Tax=unclassified Wenzhouxiangella TaxID=2613841 RepID=UPI000E3AB249|nr:MULTISPECIES: LysM peptidoglycan-binding domain-containing protein [unclassified Wenzhouxiangella]RFF27994.1 LysM peptidoglycan-binding domain-containing protein [Wenzhouxiangella sp. 15181]
MQSQHPSRSALPGTRKVLQLSIATLILLGSGCAMIETEQPAAESVAERNPADLPDPFTVVEEATRHLENDLGTEPQPARPPHLWARVVDRLAFAECPADSRAEQWAHWYGDRDEYMERVLNRARPWLYDIAGELERRQLPGELALLPIVESAYDPFAYSHGRAAGTWQFVSATARERGIEINDFYDGRRDVWAATRAALDYLEYLNNKFGDWNLALAAYNGGQGRVQRAIERNRRAGRATTWEVLPLPRETLGYVPKLNGLGCLFKEPARYGFEIPIWDNRPQVERIELDGPVDIVALSAAANIDIAELVAINPGLNGHLTPPGGPHYLMVPAARAERVREVIDQLDTEDMIVWREIRVRPGDTLSHLARRHNTTVRQLRDANNLNGDFLRTGQTLRLADNGRTPENSPHAERYARLTSLQQRLLPTRRFQHQVRPGENLWLIARQYDVTVDDLQKWNGLGNNDLIRPGDRILVNMSQPGTSQTRQYTVRSGDSLWTIAQRHDVSVGELMRWNGLAEGSILRPGQTLTIRGGGNA